jgi:hypothetical protein
MAPADRLRQWSVLWGGLLGLGLLTSCEETEGPALAGRQGSKSSTVTENGPRLGAVADVARVLEAPQRGAKALGFLQAGDQVPRASESQGNDGCKGGWFSVFPRGFVCAGDGTTLDLGHPTLVARSLRPRLDRALPYTYARTLRDARLLVRERKASDRVKVSGSLPSQSGLAVVGSWKATDEQGASLELAMTTDGRFVAASDLRPAEPSRFHGVDLDGEAHKLPVAFVLARTARAYSLEAESPRAGQSLQFHEALPLSGEHRDGEEGGYWQLTDERWLRAADITVAVAPTELPAMAKRGARWIDVAVAAGTLTLWEGERPVFVTLVSTASGDDAETTKRGSFELVSKSVTGKKLDPLSIGRGVALTDVPWVLGLSSGQAILGAFWHDDFGRAHGRGNLELSPRDAHRVWKWTGPELPGGWHGLDDIAAGTTVVVIRD